MDSDPESQSEGPFAFLAQGARGAMEPGAVVDAVETGKEDVIMEALRTYNREVSGSRGCGPREAVGRVGRASADRGCVSVCGGEGSAARRGVESARKVWVGGRGACLGQVCGVELHLLRVVPHPGSCALPRVDLRFLSLWVSLQNFQSFTFDDAQQENRKVGAYREVKGQGRVAAGGGVWWTHSFLSP